MTEEQRKQRLERVNAVIIRRAKNKNLVAVFGECETVLRLAVKICKYRDFLKNNKSNLTKKEIAMINNKISCMVKSFVETGLFFTKKQAERLGVLLSTSQNKEAKKFVFDHLVGNWKQINPMAYMAMAEAYNNAEKYAEIVNSRTN